MSKIDDLREMAEGVALGSQSNSSDILIKNDGGNDIINKTDLTNKQVKAVTVLSVLADLTGNDAYDNLVTTFMNAQVSLHRKSRGEFIANNQSIRTSEEIKAGGGIANGWWSEKV